MNLKNLPYDIELLIFRFLHEMKMNEVLVKLKEEQNLLEKVINYIKFFYPIEFVKRMKKDSLSSNKSLFYKNKILLL